MSEFKVGDIVTPKKVSNTSPYYCYGLVMGTHYKVESVRNGNIIVSDKGREAGNYAANRFHLVTSKHPLYEVIIAWAQGKQIQSLSAGEWTDWTADFDNTPLFGTGNWRVKPEKREIEEIEKEMRKLANRLEKLRKNNG